MRILLAVARRDYGNPEAGDSYEFTSWHDPLVALGHDVEIFDTFGADWVGDAARTHDALVGRAKVSCPDAVLMMLMEEEVPMSAVDAVRRVCPVVNWFADDTWRFHAFSRHIAPHFSCVVTTSRSALDGYARLRGVRALLRPWGYNSRIFHPAACEPTRDVGFVGQRYGRRGRIIERLEAAGIDVVAKGTGWPQGRVDPEALAAEFASTRINLNFLESSAGPFQRHGIRVRGTTRADRLITRAVSPPRQLKARPFEIAACGAFVLTNVVPELGEYFELHREIGVFEDERGLVERVKHYLSHDEERRTIAAAGHRRSTEYEWGSLLTGIFEQVS